MFTCYYHSQLYLLWRWGRYFWFGWRLRSDHTCSPRRPWRSTRSRPPALWWRCSCDGNAQCMCTIPIQQVKTCMFKYCLFNMHNFSLSVFCKISLPLSSCLPFEWCSLLLEHCHCLLEGSRPEPHFLPKHLQLSHCEEAQVGLRISRKTNEQAVWSWKNNNILDKYL